MKKFKAILFACILSLAVFALTACGQEKVDYSSNDWALQMAASNYLEQMMQMDDASIDATIQQMEYEQNVPLANGYNSWKSAKKELGAFVGYGDESSVTYTKDGAPTVKVMLVFEKRDCEFVIGLDKTMQKITELTFNPVYTMGEKLQQAGTNLLIGMGTVFAVLVFLAWVISLFKYVHKAEEKLEKKKAEQEAAKKETAAPVAAPAAAPKAATPVPGMTITPTPADDELKVVIAAAVAAYEEDAGCSIEKQPSLNNGIVVKSIKRG